MKVRIVHRHPKSDKMRRMSTIYPNALFNVLSSCIPICKLREELEER